MTDSKIIDDWIVAAATTNLGRRSAAGPLDTLQRFERLVAAGKPTNGFPIGEEWIDVGSKGNLSLAQRFFRCGGPA